MIVGSTHEYSVITMHPIGRRPKESLRARLAADSRALTCSSASNSRSNASRKAGGAGSVVGARAGVDVDTMLVVATTLTQAPNDKREVQPMLKVLQEQAAKLGAATTLIADTGYCSENNVKVCEEAKIVPLIAVARQDHHPH